MRLLSLGDEVLRKTLQEIFVSVGRRAESMFVPDAEMGIRKSGSEALCWMGGGDHHVKR